MDGMELHGFHVVSWNHRFPSIPCNSMGPVEFLKRFQVVKRGLCVLWFILLLIARPTVVCKFVQRQLSNCEAAERVTIHGILFGKEGHEAPPAKMRSILRLCTLLRIYDSMLASLLSQQILELMPAIPGCYVGARPETQVMGIAHGLQTVVEKGLDLKGNIAIAQRR